MAKRGRPKGSKNTTTLAKERIQKEIRSKSKRRVIAPKEGKIRVRGFRASPELQEFIDEQDTDAIHGITLVLQRLKKNEIFKVNTHEFYMHGLDIRTIWTDGKNGMDVYVIFHGKQDYKLLTSKIKQVLREL